MRLGIYRELSTPEDAQAEAAALQKILCGFNDEVAAPTSDTNGGFV